MNLPRMTVRNLKSNREVVCDISEEPQGLSCRQSKMAKMNIILAVNAIKPPLTGIGRYTWELANRVPGMVDVSSVRFFFGGRWLNNVHSLLKQSPSRLAVRQRLLRSRVAVAAYRLLSPLLLRQRLRPFADHVYHGPNFYLPPCAGPAIATFHDLSVFRYPQFHPPERVDFMQREIRLALSRASFLITDSEFVRQEVIEFFDWPEDKIRAIHLGVGEEYHPRGQAETAGVLQQYDLPYGGYALCVATIEPRKNIEALLSAYEALPLPLRNRYPLVLVGGYGWRSEVSTAVLTRAGSRVGCAILGMCRRPICRSYSLALEGLFTRRCTRDSGCRCLKPWRAACQCLSPIAHRCRKWPRGRHSLWRLKMFKR